MEIPDKPSSPRTERSQVNLGGTIFYLTTPPESTAGSSRQTQPYRLPPLDDWPLPPLPMPPEMQHIEPERPPSPTRMPPPVPTSPSATDHPQVGPGETPIIRTSDKHEGEEVAVTPAQDDSEGAEHTSDKGKGKAVKEVSKDVEEQDEDAWMRYPPPKCLWQAPHVTSEMILNLVNVSIENVRNRAAEAERVRQEQEGERQKRTEEEAIEAAKQKQSEGALNGKHGEYYLPIIIAQPQPLKQSFEAEKGEDMDFSRSNSEMIATNRRLSNGHKRHKYNLSRILNRVGVNERGESSAMGAMRSSKRKSGQEDRDARSIMTVKSTTDTRLRQLGAIATLLQKKRSVTGRSGPSTSFIVHSVSGPGSNYPKLENLSKGKGKAAHQAEETVEAKAESATETKTGDAAEESPDTVECISCFEDYRPNEMIKAPCHSYCRDCFTRLISTALQNEQQWPPKCCLNEIPFQTIYQYIQSDLRTTFETRALEWKTPVGERIYCSTPECAVWIPPNQVNGGTSTARCPAGHETCSFCRGPAHAGADCPQDWDLQRTNELAEEEGWKRCAQCHALVEHREACQHMTCRCGYQFCYVCVRQWRTCSCTVQQLNALKAEAARRREERLAREAEEQTELQDALRQIEQLELEEALEAIQQSMERERQEADRRKEEILELLHREEKRKRSVRAKFRNLRHILCDLHDSQRDLLDFEAAQDLEIFSAQREAVLSKTLENEKAELEDLRALGSARLADLEVSLTKEYAARVALERTVEEEYHARLISFYSQWKKEAGSAGEETDSEIDKAMRVLRMRLDAQHSVWKTWRDDELERVRFAIDEERGLREELLATRRRRKEEELRQQEKELGNKAKAGPKWYEAVALERTRLLNEMEMDEIEAQRERFEGYDELEVVMVKEAQESAANNNGPQAEAGGSEDFDIWVDAIEG
ncbi:hypothetical protein jhhlp_006504 [Lomentospora prolificans]|uniref:RBR-type E3 ubiquitin transferase n=1 Tax=Lomentospora prolificans TaxID=41688 RepID=A0A2N3N644_9PEZI|nr:hypothetical protein jhhlp_006504 [Lomentospora prolificans]